MPQTMNSSEKFKNQASRQMNKIIDALDEIGKLALTEDFSVEDKDKIFKRINKEVASAKKMFDLKKEETSDFSL